MASFQEWLDSVNSWLAEFQQKAAEYFSGCAQNELIAWGVCGIGFLLVVAGIIWMIL